MNLAKFIYQESESSAVIELEEIENPMVEVKRLIAGSALKKPQFGKLFIKKGDELLNYEEEMQREASAASSRKDANDQRWESLKSQIKVPFISW